MQPELELDVSLLSLMLPGRHRPKVRKGHWRRQPCGIERLSRKRIWIKTRIQLEDGTMQIINDQPSRPPRRLTQQELTLA